MSVANPGRRSALGWVLLLAAIASWEAAAAETRPAEKPKGPHLRVLTFNVNYGMPGREQALAAIEEADADLVILQEANNAWERFLRPRLKRTYPHICFRVTGGAGGQAVLAKRPVTEIAWVRPEASWFGGRFLRADTAIGPVQVLSVHLRPPADDRGQFTVASLLAAGRVHLAEIKELALHLKPDLPTLILGDFNESDDGPALKWLCERGFTNALREFDLTTPTWRWETRFGPLAARLDHILYSKGLHALEAKVIQKGSSDHYPVLGIFELKQPVEER